jgi:hypothetical protein
VAGKTQYLFLPEVFKREVCAGLDHSQVLRTLRKVGWLVTEVPDRLTMKTRRTAVCTWCRSMRTDHFAHLLTGLSPVVPGPSPVTGDTEKQGGTRLSPVSPVVPGKKHSDPEPSHPANPRGTARGAGDCLRGPATHAGRTGEAFGDEGESDWRDGYEPHCTDDYLRAFALAVAERLEREPTSPPAASPLDDLPLLPDDRIHTQAHPVSGRRRRTDRRIPGAVDLARPPKSH